MKKIYSKVNGDLLHLIVTPDDFNKPRVDLIEPNNFLQAALIRINEGDTFRPHKHIEHDIGFDYMTTQEGWIVLSGMIRVDLYDIDDKLLYQELLTSGSAVFTLKGGHTFTAFDDYTLAIEVKSGPYYGQEKDKVFI